MNINATKLAIATGLTFSLLWILHRCCDAVSSATYASIGGNDAYG